jgi:hypothetical protein
MWCWRRFENISCTDRERNKKALYRVKKRKQYPKYIIKEKGRLTDLVTSCVGTAFWNTLLKER